MHTHINEETFSTQCHYRCVIVGLVCMTAVCVVFAETGWRISLQWSEEMSSMKLCHNSALVSQFGSASVWSAKRSSAGSENTTAKWRFLSLLPEQYSSPISHLRNRWHDEGMASSSVLRELHIAEWKWGANVVARMRMDLLSLWGWRGKVQMIV